MHIHWFTHSHENRNDYLKYSLMKLHLIGGIRLSFRDLQEAKKYGFSDEVLEHEHRHTSLLYVQEGAKGSKVVVDSEDSFIWMREPIREADIYFCAGFNTDVHVHKQFVQPFSWQTDDDLANYRKRIAELIEEYGNHFHKVRKFIPIGPNMGIKGFGEKNWVQQKATNFQHKLYRLAKGEKPWAEQYQMFEARYGQLLALRQNTLKHDVVLLDTLWGWPRHRVKLHQQLRALSKQYAIYSKLKWHAPYDIDNSTKSPFPESDFPIESETPFSGNYEEMLASSKLAVFATGFHWGWRNIMTLAFMVGLPVYMDRLLLEPYFDMKEFKWFENSDQWESLERNLKAIDEQQWLEIKQHNQQVYDRWMAPEAVGRYFIETVKEG